MEIKQLRLRLINGTNVDNGIIYGESFDLTNKEDIKYLNKLLKMQKYPKGFLIEKSRFEKGKYFIANNEIEFIPMVEYIHGVENEKCFSFNGDCFTKMPYHVIVKSILEITNNIKTIISLTNVDNINETYDNIDEMLDNDEINKDFKKKVKKI